MLEVGEGIVSGSVVDLRESGIKLEAAFTGGGCMAMKVLEDFWLVFLLVEMGNNSEGNSPKNYGNTLIRKEK